MAPSRKQEADAVVEALREFLEEHPDFGALCVAFSGGRDSTVLLHALAGAAGGRAISAVHVHHGLHADADTQAEHSRRVAHRLGVPFVLREVRVSHDFGVGIEAAARHARYQSLEEGLSCDACVLAAHHSGDQAETFLLAALKGSGPAGLAAMPRLRRLGPGWLGRPLLSVSADAIAAYAARHRLPWVEDPTNEDTRFDRNFLRREVFPLLAPRFSAVSGLGTAAGIQAEALEVLEGLLDPLLNVLVGPDGRTLDQDGLLAQPSSRRSWLLRRFLTRAEATAPRRAPLLEFLRQLAQARAGASPMLEWPGFSLRSYRGRLHLLREDELKAPAPNATLIEWPRGAPTLTLPDGRVVTDRDLEAAGICSPEGVRIGFRNGGETLLGTDGHHRSLKVLMQERGVPPWERARIPLVQWQGEWVAALWHL